MSEEDDTWAHGRLTERPELEECASARVTIGGVTHRAVLQVPEPNPDRWLCGWRTLCVAHRVRSREGRFALASLDPELARVRFEFSAKSVDCLCCIPAGG